MGARRSARSVDPFPDQLPPSETVTVRAADGTRLHAEVFGPPDGYPIVLTHGITCAIRAWAYPSADLSHDYRVIAFDHGGHGRHRGARTNDYTIRRLASDLHPDLGAASTLDERAVVARDSMGASPVQA